MNRCSECQNREKGWFGLNITNRHDCLQSDTESDDSAILKLVGGGNLRTI